MTTYREELADRLIRIYGFENNIVIAFCEIAEKWENNDWNDTILTLLVEAHEEEPFFEEN